MVERWVWQHGGAPKLQILIYLEVSRVESFVLTRRGQLGVLDEALCLSSRLPVPVFTIMLKRLTPGMRVLPDPNLMAILSSYNLQVFPTGFSFCRL